MSSSIPTSDTVLDNSLINRITNCISHIQRQNIFTKERLKSIRQYFFQSIGFSIVFYCLIQILYLFYSFLKLIFQLLLFLFWLPFVIIGLILPEINNYNILYPLFWLCSISSFFIAKLSYKNICYYYETHLVNRSKLINSNYIKRYLFTITFIILLLLQSLLILLPVVLSIRQQHTHIPVVNKSTTEKLAGKDLHGNTFKIIQKEQRNTIDKTLNSSLLTSELNDDKSITNQLKQHLIKPIETIADEEQIKETLPDTLKESQEKSLTFRRRLSNLLSNVWNIWHQTILVFQQLFFSSTKHISQYSVSSIYTAYTDLNCYDYTKLINRYRFMNGKHLDFLNTYRYYSPFPVYLSILKSNGPICYQQYPNSSCALTSKLYRLTRFWMVISILIIVFAFIYKTLICKKPQITPPRQINNLSLQQTSSSDINHDNNVPLNEETEKQCRLWLEREQKDGYRKMGETCRQAFNDEFLQQNVS